MNFPDGTRISNHKNQHFPRKKSQKMYIFMNKQNSYDNFVKKIQTRSAHHDQIKDYCDWSADWSADSFGFEEMIS